MSDPDDKNLEEDRWRDEVLKRMLNTKPQKHDKGHELESSKKSNQPKKQKIDQQSGFCSVGDQDGASVFGSRGI